MKYQFIKDYSGEFPVKKMAKVLNVSKSRYLLLAQKSFHKRKEGSQS